MFNILGLDLSVDSPAFTVLSLDQHYNVKDSFMYNLQGTIKHCLDIPHVQIKRFEKTHGNKVHDRTLQIWAMVKSLIKEYDIQYVAIEGYAYDVEHSNNLTKQAEISGFIKVCLYTYQRADGTLSIPYLLLPPTTIKKFVTGKGTATKEMLMDYFFNEAAFEYLKEQDVMNMPSLNDIVDSYWIAFILSQYLLYWKINNYVTLYNRQRLEWKSSATVHSISESELIQYG